MKYQAGRVPCAARKTREVIKVNIRTIFFLVSVVTAVCVFTSVVVCADETADTRSCDSEQLLQAAVSAGSAANALKLIEEGETEKAVDILRFQLTSSLVAADRLAETSDSPKVAVPNLVESLRRAQSYVRDNHLDSDLIVAAEKAIAKLQE